MVIGEIKNAPARVRFLNGCLKQSRDPIDMDSSTNSIQNYLSCSLQRSFALIFAALATKLALSEQ